MVSTTQHQYQQSSRFEAALQHSSNSKKTSRTATQYVQQPFSHSNPEYSKEYSNSRKTWH